MAKQPYFTNTSEKQMDFESSFSGGMVNQLHPEKLRDDQSVIIENGDILANGIVQSRGAYAQTNNPSTAIPGNSQGVFRYRTVSGFSNIEAINGKLYFFVLNNNSYVNLPITGLAGGFQTTRNIEAVQYRDKMYFATGSGLVVYDGTTASLVTAYAPNGQEALYIGTNGLAVDPTTYLSDLTGASRTILGVTASPRYGVINQQSTLTAYVSKQAGDTLEYQFETKRSDEVNYTVQQAWSTNKQFLYTFTSKADYMIRVSIRLQSTTPVLSQYILPRYRVNTTPDETPEPGVTATNLNTCNRIFVHYDRLFIYGDTTNPDFLYISHLNNFTYFPRSNIIKVTDPLRGALQSVKQFREFLICFTNGSIQMITGQSPNDFNKTIVHSTIGTIFPQSVEVMRNYLVFIGNDYAVYRLAQVSATTLMMDVTRLDFNVMDDLTGLLKTSTNVLGAIYNNQYYIYIENTAANYIYRYYYELGVWVRDKVPFSYATMDNIDNVLTLSNKTGGIIYQLLSTSFKDGTSTPYNLYIKSKDYNFNLPLHRKKLKQYQVLGKITALTTIHAKIYSDVATLYDGNINYDVNQTGTDAQKMKVMVSGRFRYIKTELSMAVNEQIQLLGFSFVYKMGSPK